MAGKQRQTLLHNRKVRIVVLTLVSIGLLSFLLGYWSANWFVKPDREMRQVKTEKPVQYPVATPKKLDADKILEETGAGNLPEEKDAKPGKKPDEFMFTKTLEIETAPAVDPFIKSTPAKKKETKPETVKKEKKPSAKRAKPVKTAKAPPLKGKVYFVQVGSFSSVREARQLRARLKKRGYDVFINTKKIKGKTWRQVRVGAFRTRGAAMMLAKKLEAKEKLPTFITSSNR